MQRNTFWHVAIDDDHQWQLWAMTKAAPFHCRLWRIDAAQFTQWAVWQASCKVSEIVAIPDFLHRPDVQRTFPQLSDAFLFFATDHDLHLRGSAIELFSVVDPDQFAARCLEL